MKDKYFVPDIEDFRVGYEYQKTAKFMNFDKWKNCTFGTTNTRLETIGSALYTKEIRVSYLTKEQIEAEGWIYSGKAVDLWFKKDGNFQIGSWTAYQLKLHYGLNDHRLYVYAEDCNNEHPLFEGECKSINEFRYICKLLKI